MHVVRKARPRLELVFIGGLLAACQDTSPTTPSAASARQAGTPSAAPAIQHSGEAIFEEISSAVPAFAGFHFEGDNLVVHVTDLGQRQAAELAVRRSLSDPRHGTALLASRPAVGRAARYTFTQLRDWRDLILEQGLFTTPDVASIDLDEVRNRIAIGLADGSGRGDLERWLGKLALDSGAVTIEITARTQPHTDSLTGKLRPLVGGLSQAVKYGEQFSAVPWSTYSFSARYNGVDVILVNSHSTATPFGTDNPVTVWYQRAFFEEDRIGTEWYDPPYFTKVTNPRGFWLPPASYPGRYSDAAMIRLDPGVSFALGYIARPTARITSNDSGPKTIDTQNPFRIIQTRSYPLRGERVDKVGRRSGWTSGLVTDTCVDEMGADTYVRFCTYRAEYFSRGGDSGAPVFIWPGSGNNVTLVGIHWGSGEGVGAFSPMGGVYQEFGAMTVEKPLASVTISGPSLVDPPGNFTWQAVPSGGLAPYAYKWWVHYFNSGVVDSLGTGQSQDLYIGGPVCGNLEMGVRLTSGSESDTETHYVNTYTVSPPECGGGGVERPVMPRLRTERARKVRGRG